MADQTTTRSRRFSSNIKNLFQPGLPEAGHIKIGKKGREIQKKSGEGTYQMPMRLDHFIVTGMERGPDGNFLRDEIVHKALKDAGLPACEHHEPIELPVRFVYNDLNLNFQSRLAAYKGKSVWCSGDGEFASRAVEQNNKPTGRREEVECPCFRLESDYDGADKCKVHGILNVVMDLPGMAGRVGGVYKLRTTSWNSTQGILSSLTYIRQLTGGPLANIPFKLCLRPKTTTTPKGEATTVHIVSIQYDGDDSQLRGEALKLLTDDRTYYSRMEKLEAEVSSLSRVDVLGETEEEEADIADEFHPDAVIADKNLKVEQPEPETEEPKRRRAGSRPPQNASSNGAPEQPAEPKPATPAEPEQPQGQSAEAKPEPTLFEQGKTEQPKTEAQGEKPALPKIEDCF